MHGEDTSGMNEFKDIGNALKSGREAQGLSLGDVSAKLRISTNYLEKLEQGNRNGLPSMAYIIGFVRSYAKLVKIDSDPLCRELSAMMGDGDGDRKSEFRFASERRDKTGIMGIYALVAIALVAAAYSVWYLNTINETDIATVIGNGETSLTSSPDLIKDDASTLIAEPTAALADETELAASFAGGRTMVLKAVTPSWVEIKTTDGDALVAKVFEEGERFVIPNVGEYFLSAENAGAIYLGIEGDEILWRPLGDVGEAISRTRLDEEIFSN